LSNSFLRFHKLFYFNNIFQITLTKLPCAERQITLSVSELEIQGYNFGTIYIKWFPKEAGCWRDVVQLTDNRRVKYDIVISTTAKSDKKTIKTMRKPLLPKSNFSTSVAQKPFQQNKISNASTAKILPLVNNFDTQVKQHKSKYKNNLNKENVFKIETRTDILREKDKCNKINENHERNKLDLSDQSMNVSWKDGNVLPQILLPLNEPQDIRRATYIKEKSCNNIIRKHDERVTENTASMRNNAQSDFSIMLNKFTLTSTDALLSSPQVIKESINLQSSDKHRTFDIVDFIEVPATSPAGSHNLSLNKFEMSFVTDVNNLIASSPIGKLQHCDTSKEPDEYSKHFTIDVNRNTQKSECEYFSFEVIPENIEGAKKAGDVYIEISPPKKHSHSKSLFMSSKSSARTGKITKNKALCDMKSVRKLNVATSKIFF